MPKQAEKRKRVNLSVTQKLELIEKIEKGASVAIVCEQYGVKKQTVSDIRNCNRVRNTAFSFNGLLPTTDCRWSAFVR